MGRKRKYFTEKEKKEAQKKWQMEHYERNKEIICKRARERYQKKKKEIFPEDNLEALAKNPDRYREIRDLVNERLGIKPLASQQD